MAYSSPGMLISRKVTKDKRVVTDLRHLNVKLSLSIIKGYIFSIR